MSYQIPPDARPAASLLLVRDGDAGLEVLLMRRAEREGDLRGGACVFPGGGVEPGDHHAVPFSVGGDDAELSRRFRIPAGALDYAVAALRETFEEVGLLLLDGDFDAAVAADWRPRLQRGEAGAAELAAALGRRWDLSGLAYHSHWLTPPSVPKRFDTRFFIARAPAGQQAEADLGEAVELMWLTPQAALAPERALKLMPVTRHALQELSRFASADAALADAMSREEIPHGLPHVARSRDGERVVLLPHQRGYAEIGRLDPAGRGDACAEIVAGRAIRLSANVVRVTAPNPGAMTGPGTNTYLVGGGGDWTAIDPGPVDAAHLQAVLAAVAALGGRITRILVTHTHRDHSPGAEALAQATGAPVWGRVAAHPMWQDERFAPQHQPQHGERIGCGDDVALRAIHTPGHASNHLCFLLEREKLLFTGDHVMQGSTVVINPPDGDMAAYLGSLRSLLDEDLDWLAPGHGFLVAQPHAVLRALIQHRLAREAKVRAALQRLQEAALPALLAWVYDDVPAALHAVAARSLLAHLLKLQGDGEASSDGEIWRFRG